MKKFVLFIFLLGCGYWLNAQTTANIVQSYDITTTSDTTLVQKVNGNFGWSLLVDFSCTSDTALFEVMASNDGIKYSKYSTSMGVYSYQMDTVTIGGTLHKYIMFDNSYFTQNYIGLRMVNVGSATGTVSAILVLKK